MSNAALSESTGVNPVSVEGLTGRAKPELGELDPDRLVITESAGDGSRIPGGLVAVQLTQAEWDEQDSLFAEHSHCITRDRQRAAEILPMLIWPAWLLKGIKKLMGANHIRKEGYNTLDADLAYGPGWLDEDDGGPESTFSEDYKPLVGYEIPEEWRE